MSANFCAWRKVWHYRFVVSCRLVRYKSIQQYQIAKSKQVNQHLNNPPNVLLNYSSKFSIIYFQTCVNFVEIFYIFIYFYLFLYLYQLLQFHPVFVILMILPSKCYFIKMEISFTYQYSPFKSFKTIIVSKHIFFFKW